MANNPIPPSSSSSSSGPNPPELSRAPAAPYPPLRFPTTTGRTNNNNANVNNSTSAPGRSVLSASSPQYSSTGASMTTGVTGTDRPTTSLPTTTTTNSSGGGKNNNYNNPQLPAHASQMKFYSGSGRDGGQYDHNMVASINCVATSAEAAARRASSVRRSSSGFALGAAGSVNGSNSSSNTTLRKLGPVMMELRRVEVAKRFLDDNDDHDDGDGQEEDDTASSFFTARTVAVSRGNPSLGLSVASTCLDLPPPFSAIVRSYNDINSNSSSNSEYLLAATGSTTGALCIHRFDMNKVLEEPSLSSTAASSIEYFQAAGHRRPATAVAWRTGSASVGSNNTSLSHHVAIGLVGSNTTAANMKSSSTSSTTGVPSTGPSRRAGSTGMLRNSSQGTSVMSGQRATFDANGLGTVTATGSGTGGGIHGGSGRGFDREFCCFLWDIIGMDGNSKTSAPLSKLAHNSPVASLAWLMDGQTLAVGSQQRTIQLYDLRTANDNAFAPTLSAHAHESGVHGIDVDPYRPHLIATFCRAVGEPVKLFDIRRMDSTVSDIKISNFSNQSSGSSGLSSLSAMQGTVESIQWSALDAGVLAVASGSSVAEYDTNNASRPTLVRLNYVPDGHVVKGMALYRGVKRSGQQTDNVPIEAARLNNEPAVKTLQSASRRSDELVSLLYPRRMLTVLEDRKIHDLARDTSAPIAISRRDGRLVHGIGPWLWAGSSSEGPSAMERTNRLESSDDDISAIMMSRARCAQVTSYSMDPELNIKLLSSDILQGVSGDETDHVESPLSDVYSSALLRLWSWVHRIEVLSSSKEVEEMDNEAFEWPAKGLLDSGAWKLLGFDVEASQNVEEDEVLLSESLACNVYDSHSRRAALVSCGWVGKLDLDNVMAECERLGEFERSAALAVWHGDIGAAVAALQRASESLRLKQPKEEDPSNADSKYTETLDLIAMCIAGFGGRTASQLSIWRSACSTLLQREDLSSTNTNHTRTAYLRSLCQFLINVVSGESMSVVTENANLSLCDRVAFACRFLERKELKIFLMRSIEDCGTTGNLEGLVATGLSKRGINILQAFVDRYVDVQTAALVASRVILPSDWTAEKKVCLEWVESYRNLLNTWQMWQSRAMFDVDRADLLRRMKSGSMEFTHQQQRRPPTTRARPNPRSPDPDIVSSIPAQMEVRCNYCSSPLSLKQNQGVTNAWLSKMQPLLICCPNCRKPLPRCSICLLSMSALNPYTELTRERRGAGGMSSLSSQSFAEWWSWCARCRHGGHAHHLIGWFSKHKTCPVSGCDCQCEFDAASRLLRPALGGKDVDS